MPRLFRLLRPMAVACVVTTGFVLVWCLAACRTHREPPNIEWFDGEPRGHSHNDYGRRVPLHEALRHGFCSVEADVFLRNGALLVGHDEWMLHPSRTLESLYLDPLRERVHQNGGTVHGDGRTFLLLVDIKQRGEEVYAELRRALAERRELLTTFSGTSVDAGAITVVLSGNRPITRVANEATRLVAIDGRLADLDRNPPSSLVPLVSAPWTGTFAWDGRAEIPPNELSMLRSLANRAKAQGRMLRFWGAPDLPPAWAALRSAGVNWINTDRPGDFAAWDSKTSR